MSSMEVDMRVMACKIVPSEGLDTTLDRAVRETALARAAERTLHCDIRDPVWRSGLLIDGVRYPCRALHVDAGIERDMFLLPVGSVVSRGGSLFPGVSREVTAIGYALGVRGATDIRTWQLGQRLLVDPEEGFMVFENWQSAMPVELALLILMARRGMFDEHLPGLALV